MINSPIFEPSILNHKNCPGVLFTPYKTKTTVAVKHCEGTSHNKVCHITDATPACLSQVTTQPSVYSGLH